MAKPRGRDPLLLRVCAELGAGKITEAFIHDPGSFTDGMAVGDRIYINEYHQLVDSILHECLHRMEPTWHENYVRRTVSWLRNRMSDREVIAVVEEYRRRATKRKRAVKASDL